MNYYVYYKVDVSRLPELRAQVERLFQSVEKACGVRGRWMRRRDDPATYMEVYEDVGDEPGFERALQRAALDFPYARRTELFQCA